MRRRLVSIKMVGVAAVILVLFMAVGVAGEELTDASGQWKYFIKDGGAAVTGYAGAPKGELVFPGELDGVPVTDIGIGYANDQYEGMLTITSVTIPDTVVRIFPFPFIKFEKLERIEVLPGNPAYEAVDGVLFDKREGMLVIYPLQRAGETYAVPEGTRSIGEFAFTQNTKLTGITLPGSLAGIGNNAFSGLRGLTSIVIPGSVTIIGDSAFGWCSSLTSATLMEGVTEIGASAFITCRNLTRVDIPPSVTSIGFWAFASCDSLASLTIPASVTRIGEVAFGDCDALTLTVAEGSYAEEYAKENNIPYIFTTE